MSELGWSRSLGARVVFALWVILALVVACAPADLDITPTPEPTALPTSTPTPTPPPASAAVNKAILDIIIDSFPTQLAGGGSEWRPDPSKADNGREVPRITVPGGVGMELHYTESVGGTFSVTFAVFDDAAGATEHYEWIRGLRSVLQTGKARDDFPMPNIFGQGLYGSIALVQLDNIFIEVSISAFTSSVNPLRSLTQTAVNHVLGLEDQLSGRRSGEREQRRRLPEYRAIPLADAAVRRFAMDQRRGAQRDGAAAFAGYEQWRRCARLLQGTNGWRLPPHLRNIR